MSSFFFVLFPRLGGLVFLFQVMVTEATGTKEKSHEIDHFNDQLETASKMIERNPSSVRGWSIRGDMKFFSGNFKGAKEDYQRMIEIDPRLDISHWRLGIVYFYLEDFDKAARQFEIYHNYDSVDRENGIWRFMSQFKKDGLTSARRGLLKYEKDDRPPYPWLYEMFAGRMTPEEIFSFIEKANFPQSYKVRVLFHAHFYVGIYLDMVEGKEGEGKDLLRKAFENEYGRETGTYMWQVARIHYHLLLKRKKFSKDKK